MKMAKQKLKMVMSRTKRNALQVAFCLVLLPSASILDHLAGAPLRQAITRYTLYTDDQKKYHEKEFQVMNVIDGDTIDIQMSDGVLEYTRIRLLGIDTPETNNPKTGIMYYGSEATEYTKQLIADQPVTILIDTVADQRDYYGRLLAYIKLQDGSILNEQIIKNGYGYADLRFDHSHCKEYKQLMNQAIESKNGLWKKVTRDQLPTWLRQKRPLFLRD